MIFLKIFVGCRRKIDALKCQKIDTLNLEQFCVGIATVLSLKNKLIFHRSSDGFRRKFDIATLPESVSLATLLQRVSIATLMQSVGIVTLQ